jgi:hypothetical protein
MEILKPFDVVSASYPSLDGTMKSGLFVVLYNEQGNSLCAKLTSQFDSRFMHYAVLVLQKTNPFLQCDSYIQLDKLITLNSLTCRVIGRLAPIIRRSVKEVLNRFHYEVLQKLNENIKSDYVSPNLKQN